MSTERHLTYVGGASAKFWHVSQDGAELSIRYGRLGAAGQTQVKSFDTAEAATAAAGKLVAEKLRKGYTEDDAAVAETPGDGPRRGSLHHAGRVGAQPPPAPGRGAGAREAPTRTRRRRSPRRWSNIASRSSTALARTSDPEIAAAGAAYLAGDAGEQPAGGGDDRRSGGHLLGVAGLDDTAALAEVWLAERGLVFAAVAVTELSSLHCGHGPPVLRPRERPRPAGLAAGRGGRPQPLVVREPGGTAPAGPGSRRGGVGRRVRRGGGRAGPVSRTEGRTSGWPRPIWYRPRSTGWTPTAPKPPGSDSGLATTLIAAISTPGQAELIAGHLPTVSVTALARADGHPRRRHGRGGGAGGDATGSTARRRFGCQWWLAALLAELPTDEAMQALIERGGDRRNTAGGDPAGRWPASPAGRCGCWPRPMARSRASCCASHVVAHPHLADAVLAEA